MTVTGPLPLFRSGYYTDFGLTENPISEGSRWLNGLTDGLDWADAKSVNGNVVGTQIKNEHYNDTTAVLVGVWPANQRVRCTVFKNSPATDGQPEIEIRLRCLLAAHQNRGYEILYSLPASYNCQIVRWDGLDDFHYIGEGTAPVVNDGDVIEAQIIGSDISAWLNGNLIATAQDNTYTDGNPGIGFWNVSQSQSENDKFGFKDFHAWAI